jgi:hypothetical protein
MHIVDLGPDHRADYFACLEEYEPSVREGRRLKQRWYDKMSERGLRVKLAIDDANRVGGMIQYLPVEHTAIQGHDLYVVLCIWVHGHDRGRGNFQGRGMGKALLAAAELDARALGARGMVAWGLWLPIWMRASWFQKQGYESVDRRGLASLVWKPFSPLAVPPRWLEPKKLPVVEPGQLAVTAFVNGWCPGINATCERARRACEAAGNAVTFREIDTTDPEVRSEWGIVDALYFDDREVRSAPPPSYERLARRIAKKSRRASRRPPTTPGRAGGHAK